MMRYIFVVFLLLHGVFMSEELTDTLSKRDPSDMKIVCYYSNWSVYRPGLAEFTPQNINPFLCTHLIYAFAALDKDYDIRPYDPYNDIEQGNYKKFVGLKSYNPELKTMIAVGGWNEGSERFSQMVADYTNRQHFIHSVIRYLREYGFDGLEVDWEYPGFRDGGSEGDRYGYGQLIRELREAFDAEKTSAGNNKLILSIGVPAGKEHIDKGFDISTITEHVDFMNVLSYDYHTPYESETHHHSPLSRRPDFSRWDRRNRLNIEWTIDYYLELGAVPEKLIVGIPIYGRSYTLLDPKDNKLEAPTVGPGKEGPSTKEKGYMAYFEICQNILDGGWTVRRPYPELMGPYAFKGDQWLSFDDTDMIIQKAKFILKRGLGGAMVWTLDNDDFRGICGVEQNPLVNALRKTLFSNSIDGYSKRILAREENGANDQVYRPPIVDSEEKPNKPNIQQHEIIQSHPTTESPKHRNPVITPTPPPTTNPVTSFTCPDEGFYSNKQDCRKYFWCLDSGPAELGVVPHAFTCPSGLYFSSKMEACDYPENVVCDSHSVLSAPVSVEQTTPRPVITTTEPLRNLDNEDGNTLNNFQSGKIDSRNLADLLRLLQSIGGVDRLQNILGSESTKQITTNNLSRKQNQKSIKPQVLSEYITPQKAFRTEVTTEQFRPSITEPPTTLTTPSSTTYAPPHYRRTFSPLLYRPATLDEEHRRAYQPENQLTNQVPRRLQYEALENSDKVFKYVEPKQQKQQNVASNYHVNKKAGLSAVHPTSTITTEHEVTEQPNTQAASSEKGIQSLVSDPFIYQTSFYEEDLTTTENPVLSTPGPKEESKVYLVPVRIQDGKVVRIRGQNGQGRRTRIRVRSRPAAIRTQELDNLSEDTLHKRRLEVHRRPVFANNYEYAGSVGIMRLADEQKLIKETENERDYEYVAIQRNRQGRARNRSPKTTTVRITTTTTTDEPTTTTTQTPTTPSRYLLRYRLPVYQPPLQEIRTQEESSDITSLGIEHVSSRLSNINRTYISTTFSPPRQSVSTTSTTTTTTPRPYSRPITTTSTTIATTTKRFRPTKRRRITTTTTTTTPELAGPPVIANGEDIECLQRGLFRHPHDCGRFVVCAPSDTEGYFRSFVHKCPADRIFMEEIGRCTFGDKDNCQAVK
ncbi:uncharacterized protein LOC143225125 isoform X2 [Tachypleus tridentatus]|uniref:uncharacterized protein LOC143225125 isoform X2 n=1 Tax=Tachypleus tridentatus TaxID=6853 RepID=UPI003FD3E54F